MTSSIDRLGLNTFRLVRPPRALRKLAYVLGVLFLLLPVVLAAVPWQQNVQAQGRVIALDPLDREQTIPAPVTGRLVELNVREGSRVTEGEVLARMEDLDDQYLFRLEQQLGLAREKLRAANDMAISYESERLAQESARDHAITSAEFAYQMAIQGVLVAEQDLEGALADLDQKRQDFERKRDLQETGTVSDLEFQKAERDYLAAEAKVEAAKAKVEQAENNKDAKEADREKIAEDMKGKISAIEAKREDAFSKAALAESEVTEKMTSIQRQNTQVIKAPRNGTVRLVHAANNADYLVQGEPLIEFVPDPEQIAVELRVRGIDAPLIAPGRKVRLQFEGWPAVQFAGWPSVAVGTFGGEVIFIDAQADKDGKFRVIVVPDAEDAPWPDLRYLRQGVRANGWCLLDTVSVGYEVWRNLNAFPPSVENPPHEEEKAKPKPKGDKK